MTRRMSNHILQSRATTRAFLDESLAQKEAEIRVTFTRLVGPFWAEGALYS